MKKELLREQDTAAGAHVQHLRLVAPSRVGEIEKGVPLPKSKRGDGTLHPTMKRLEIGDSFSTTFSRAACYQMAKKLDIKIEIRPEGKRIRVWRTA